MDKVPHCCSEAGTMAMSRPDISNAMLDRKKELIQTVRNGQTEQIKMLTNCPSCLQGLGRNQDTGITPVHIACELAERSGGTNWEKELIKLMKNSEVITF
jgi:Fe-S oxidoreductase